MGVTKSNTLRGSPKNTPSNSCLPFGIRTRLIFFYIYTFTCVYYFRSALCSSPMSCRQTDSHICIPRIDSNKSALYMCSSCAQRSVVIIACLLANKLGMTSVITGKISTLRISYMQNIARYIILVYNSASLKTYLLKSRRIYIKVPKKFNYKYRLGRYIFFI